MLNLAKNLDDDMSLLLDEYDRKVLSSFVRNDGD